MAGNLDPAEIAIRPSRPEDRDALVELDLASAAHHVAIDPEVYRMPERDAVALFLDRRLASADREVLVAVVGGAVVGRVDLTMLEPPDDGSIVRPRQTADLGVSVLASWRGRGIGRALMAAAEAWAREHGAEQIVLDMSANNIDALHFYRGLGYTEHALFLRRRLR